MKKYLLPFAIALLALAGCQNNGGDEPEAVNTGLYVLNNGSWGSNNANLGIYDTATKKYTPDVFATVNGQGLGDLGQDILSVGEDVYIAVNGSQVVFVTDQDLKIKKTIVAEVDGTRLSPRYLCAGGDKVYVTYYEGYLGEINTRSYEVRTTAVGPNPEGCFYTRGKIYVANSGGYLYPTYNNTVSVVDATYFVETSTITVNTNPALVKAYDGNVFVSSLGNYADIAPKIQRIDVETGKVYDLPYSSPSGMALSIPQARLYVLCGGYDEAWNPLPGTVYQYNAEKCMDLGKLSVDDVTIPNAYSISATSYMVCVGSSDYKTDGDFYVFDTSGHLFDKFDSKGINPQCIAE